MLGPQIVVRLEGAIFSLKLARRSVNGEFIVVRLESAILLLHSAWRSVDGKFIKVIQFSKGLYLEFSEKVHKID